MSHTHNFFKIFKGDTFSFGAQLKQTVDGEQVPVNLTSKPISFVLFVSDPAMPVLSLSRVSGITVTDLEGLMVIDLNSGQTNVAQNRLNYRLEVDSNTILSGFVRFNV